MRPAPSFIVRKLHAIAPSPWRNGGGVTRELARAGGWRVSVADVAAGGPFSLFAGQCRQSVVMAGAGLDLRGPGGVLALDPMQCVRYDGGLAWQATLRAGPVRVFNLMNAAGSGPAQLLVSPAQARAPAGGVCLALCAGADVRCESESASPLRLVAGDFILFTAAAGTLRFVPLRADACVLLARIAPGGPNPSSNVSSTTEP